MLLNSNSLKPIYLQIAEYVEGEILNDSIQPDEKMYSQYQLADMFNINPATAAKGINLLTEEGILYKRRGLGMFVSNQAKEIILTKRRSTNLKNLILELIQEANQLGVKETELVEMVREAIQQNKEE